MCVVFLMPELSQPSPPSMFTLKPVPAIFVVDVCSGQASHRTEVRAVIEHLIVTTPMRPSLPLLVKNQS